MRLQDDPERSRPADAVPKELAGRDVRPTGAMPTVVPKIVAASSSSLRRVLQIWWRQGWLPAVLLGVATLLAYWPCLHGGFVWDDDAWTLQLRGLFQSLAGLGRVWTDPTALQQYYPLSGTSFWVDYHLWGFWTLPYHLENVCLHLLGALLFWRLLKKLEMPGAGLAAAILALHPLMVESVAWITERKNVLSLVLYLGALLWYGRFTHFWRQEAEAQGSRGGPQASEWKAYLCALLLFVAAYLAKATAFSLPAVVLLLGWWKRGRVRWREDFLPTLPFFAVSFGLGAITAWLERTHVGANGPDWNLSWPERCLVAGRAPWFYAGKLIQPANLCFIYPRWQLNPASLGQWGWPAAAVGLILGLWFARRRMGRGPLTAVLFFVGTLFPVLGFLKCYFMRYSFVCDHWVYLSSLGLIALGAALMARLAESMRQPVLSYGCAAILLPAFAILSWRQSALFSDSETLYRATLALNPNADLAHNNLGLLLAKAGQVDEAIAHFERAVEIRPGSAHAHNNLANAFRFIGQAHAAAEQYELSLKLEPDNANTCNNLALLLATSLDASVRDGRRAVELAERAQRLTHNQNPIIMATLAATYAEVGRFSEAVSTARQALRLIPNNPDSQFAKALQSQLELYSAGSAFHEPEPDRSAGKQ